jgi:hypothetical protein
MIPSRQEIAYRVYGAWLLARFDARGLDYFDASPQAALRSFFAAVLTLSAFAVISLLTFRQPDLCTEESAPVVAIVFALYYCLIWAAPAVVMHRICLLIDRESAFFRFLAASNWSSVVAFHLQVAVALFTFGDFLPEPVASLPVFAADVYVLVYQWFITRHSLNVTPLTASGLVFLQFVLIMLIAAFSTGAIFQPA